MVLITHKNTIKIQMMFLRSFFWQVISMVQDEVVIYLIQSLYNPFLHASPEFQFEFCFLESSDERFFKAGSWAAHQSFYILYHVHGCILP